MTITALPAAPDPATDTPAQFSTKAAAWVLAMATFTTEANALAVAMNLNSTTDTSASSVLIGTGTKTFTVSTGKSFQPGMYLVIADTAAPSTNSMFGQVTSYLTNQLVMNIISVLGSGTKTAWTISQSSAGGATLGTNLFTGLQAEAEGAAVASAGTIDIWATDGNTRHITGSTGPITSMGTAPQAGVWMKVIFDGTPTLTHSANLNLNGNGSDIVIEAGDYAFVYADTTTQLDVIVIRKSGAAVVSGSLGQCRLTLSAGSLKLSPYNGNKLTVNGVTCTVPDAGVTLAATGLSATTLYYIYATQSGGAIDALEASTTGHSTDTAAGNKGVEIKTGDSTRTLVGMAYVKTAATFADSLTQRFVASWFNPKRKTAMVVLGADSNRTEGTDTEINSSYLAEACMFAQTPKVFGRAHVGNSVAASTSYFITYLDAAIPTGGQDIGIFTTATNNVRFNTKVEGAPTSDLADGYHTVKGYGKVSGGTATYYATYSAWGMDFEG